MIGILLAGVVATVVGGIAAFQWGEGQKIEAAGKAKGAIIWADELEKWLPWVLVALILIVTVAVSFLLLRRWGK